MFWESIEDSPWLHGQLVALAGRGSYRQLAHDCGFDHHEQLIRYLRGPLMKALERHAGGEAVQYLKECLAEKGL